MSIYERLNVDLKAALLEGNKNLVSVLRNLKSSLTYAEIAKSQKPGSFSDDEIVSVFLKELKKREDAAVLYKQAGNSEKMEAELYEKNVIEDYLPPRISQEDLDKLIDESIASIGSLTSQNIGKVIQHIKNSTQGIVDVRYVSEVLKKRVSA